MQPDPRAYLWDVREAVQAIQTFVAGLDATAYAATPLVHSAETGGRSICTPCPWLKRAFSAAIQKSHHRRDNFRRTRLPTEPATITLLAAALLGSLAVRARRRSK